MEKIKLSDININYRNLITPDKLKEMHPLSNNAKKIVLNGRNSIKDILDGKDERKFIILGPCSIHNIDESIEYASKLKELSDKVKDKFLLIMRTYFEKPRTTIGWEGFIYDPDLDGSFNLKKGYNLARKLLVEIAEIGVPSATEFLDPITPQYIDDLISWAAIGARTTESQIHRRMSSGLSMPIGFKNSTYGHEDVAIDAIKSAQYHHCFPGIDKEGKVCAVETKGNKYCHVVLRGGDGTPNYHSEQVEKTQQNLRKQGLKHNIVIDCSHGNSNKDYKMQSKVFNNVIEQIVNGNKGIIGLMLESNLREGKQHLPKDPSKLEYGRSITDSCIGMKTTENIILQAYNTLNEL